MVSALRNLLLLLALAAGLAQAEPDIRFQSGSAQVHLLELYTSQGCSSCPAADQWLSTLTRDDRLWHQIVPVALHVDYWDWIGWQDRFAKPGNSARQRAYLNAGFIQSVYTPGFVVDGSEWRGWFSRKTIPTPAKVAGILSGEVAGSVLTIHYSDFAAHPALVSHVALLGFDLKTPVSRGENTQKTLHEDFVALWYQQATASDGTWTLTLPDKGPFDAQRYGIAVWITPADSPQPIQASGTWF